MSGTMGPLLAADEGFNHQIVETFATVSQTDHAWAEKVCGMVAARDGSLQACFGFGKYQNRNVVDGYGGVARQKQQWNLRASRQLDSEPDSINVGPLRYEIIEPLKTIRVVLEPNDTQPIAFDLLLEGLAPCIAEEREDRRSSNGYRRTADQIRYHQTGTVSGWIEVAGERTEVTPEDWIMTRDHSWGVRPGVGAPLTDLAPEPMETDRMDILAVWNPLLFQNRDGSTYAFHQYVLSYQAPGLKHQLVQGGFEYADGRRDRVLDIDPQIHFDPQSKRFLHGEFHLRMANGEQRVLNARAISDTGFYLAGGLYHGFEGKYHGQYRGPLHLEGEYIADVTAPEELRRLNQFRDCLIVVEDQTTGATGWGNCQTYFNSAR